MSRSGTTPRHGWAAGPGRALRLAAAEARLFTRRPRRLRRVHRRLSRPLRPACRPARSRTGGRSSSTRSSRSPTRSSRTAAGSAPARCRPARSRRSTAGHFARPTSSSPTRQAHADFFAELAGLDRVEVCFVGAEDRLFQPGWTPPEPFTALFVGKLIPLQGVETILAAARLAPELHVPRRRQRTARSAARRPARRTSSTCRGSSTSACRPSSSARGCALGIFGTSAKARRVIPNKAFQALACGDAARHRGHARRPRAARRRRERAARPAGRRGSARGASGGSPPTPSSPQRIAAGGRAAYEQARKRGGARRPLARAHRAAVVSSDSASPRRASALRRDRRVCGRVRRALGAASPRRSSPAASTSGTWCRPSGRPRTATRCSMTDLHGDQISRLAAHVDPILVLFAPLWWIWPSPDMLLVVAGGRRSRSARCPSSGSRASISARSARPRLRARLPALPGDRLADAERVPSGCARDAPAAVRVLVPRRGPARSRSRCCALAASASRRRSRSSSPASASGTRSRADAG